MDPPNTNHKMKLYTDGGLTIMGNTRVFGVVTADNLLTLSDEHLKYDITPIGNKLCLDTVKNVEVTAYARLDIDKTDAA